MLYHFTKQIVKLSSLLPFIVCSRYEKSFSLAKATATFSFFLEITQILVVAKNHVCFTPHRSIHGTSRTFLYSFTGILDFFQRHFQTVRCVGNTSVGGIISRRESCTYDTRNLWIPIIFAVLVCQFHTSQATPQHDDQRSDQVGSTHITVEWLRTLRRKNSSLIGLYTNLMDLRPGRSLRLIGVGRGGGKTVLHSFYLYSKRYKSGSKQ